MKNILMVEDEVNISDFVKLELEYEGYNVCIKNDGKEGLREALKEDYDLIILDIMLPSMNGFEICRRLKKEKNVPIIILSARDSVIDKVNGLQIGADDYIAKPFSIEELLARIQAVIRRTNNSNDSIVKFKDITINKKSRIVKKNDEEINLTNKEYELLMFLIDNKDNVVTRDEILDNVWGYDVYLETNVIDVYIRYLRMKLNQYDKEEYIKTIRSVGYTMRS